MCTILFLYVHYSIVFTSCPYFVYCVFVYFVFWLLYCNKRVCDSLMFWALWHQSMSTYSRPSFSSSSWKRGGVWTYRAESRSGHSTVVSIRVPETVHGVKVGVARLVSRQHLGDAVCGRDCCCYACVVGVSFGVILGEFEWYLVAFYG